MTPVHNTYQHKWYTEVSVIFLLMYLEIMPCILYQYECYFYTNMIQHTIINFSSST